MVGETREEIIKKLKINIENMRGSKCVSDTFIAYTSVESILRDETASRMLSRSTYNMKLLCKKFKMGFITKDMFVESMEMELRKELSVEIQTSIKSFTF